MSLDPLTQGTAKAMALRIVQFLAIMFTAIVTLFGSAAPDTSQAPQHGFLAAIPIPVWGGGRDWWAGLRVD